MSNQFLIENAVCAEHQRLVEESERALEIWKEHRAEFCQLHLSRKEAGDELLRLQAKYARAYTVLRNHTHNCSLCQLASGTGERNTEDSSRAFPSNILHRSDAGEVTEGSGCGGPGLGSGRQRFGGPINEEQLSAT